MAALSRAPQAYGQRWHLPTRAERIISETFVRLACAATGRPYGVQMSPRWLLRVTVFFAPMLRANEEMLCQFDTTIASTAAGSLRR